MDRNQVIGLTLIFLLMIGWGYMMQPSEQEQQRMRQERAVRDSLALVEKQRIERGEPKAQPVQREAQLTASGESRLADAALGVFTNALRGDTVLTVVENELYRAVFSSVGAGPVSFELKTYNTWDGRPVQMVSDSLRSAYSIGFLTTQNYNVDTERLVFKAIGKPSHVDATNREAKLEYALELEEGRSLVLTYTFLPDTYEIDLDITFNGMSQLISDRRIDFGWKPRLNYTEQKRKLDGQFASAWVYAGKEYEQLILTEAGRKEQTVSGNVDWIATKTKFFTQIIKPETPTDGAVLSGEVIGKADTENVQHDYKATLRIRLADDNKAAFRLYVGPLRYYSIVKYDETAYHMVDVGYKFLRFFSDPFVRYLIIPYFEHVGNWLGNFGIAIILFALLIKLVLYPLTKKSFESMAAMREIQPEMAAIREKYADNPQKQQEMIMKLYKEAKVNPLGGCLPNLLQLPILVTLWMFFQNSLLIRQKSFLWASDLSAPDIIINLPFNIPFLGDYIGGFVLLMAASMVVQMQISGQTQSNPQMKFLPYIMPVVLFFFFNSMASGLSLYYLIYNTASIIQQMMINKEVDHVALMQKVDKKKATEMQKQLDAEKKPGKGKNK